MNDIEIHPKSTHNLYYHRLYKTWHSMLLRCYNPLNPAYKDYGGRGITTCDEWKDTPTQFIEDMFPSFQEGLTLDRIDNDKGYSKENCRWATRSEQAINRGKKITNTSGYTGVGFIKRANKFVARINVNTKRIIIGYYTTSIEAAEARNKFILENNLSYKLAEINEELT